ncbi:hypothetical protein PV08_10218 [Exophiala spinifera]|uniref:Uncharacterized protein n=1 Tax=Exophiala spinifera TaxID=91928 RepID=A0A0D2BHR5_9EURO|nr:uncharacterized protein PV08_10218 [Exophiala spinifera]KIW10919.1 hypothetical protein PV08_10218 [Exophiala spinifera]
MSKSIVNKAILSYFFCQATDSRVNNAVAVLRGLIYMLVCQRPSLISHVQEKYKHAGKDLFQDQNAWIALSEIFTNLLQDPSLDNTYLIIDALDECVEGLPKLLGLIAHMSSASRVKWIVSSRNWPSIDKDLDPATLKVRLCLELNEKSVSAAVTTYIHFKVDWLAKRHRYDSDTRDAVLRHLSLNANGTFLWVALVCQELADISEWDDAEEMSKAFPPGLNPLYTRMLDQIGTSKYAKLCKSILAVVSTVRRPITLDELKSFVDMPARRSGNSSALAEIIELCGSFLTLQERTIFFVHQSAKDFLVKERYNDIYPSGREHIHQSIFWRSLQLMLDKLKRDVYGLGELGISIDQVKQPDPDPLSPARYSCVYWIDHLLCCDHASNDLRDGGSVDKFLRQKFLYWLEALSLCRSMSNGIVSMAKLETLIQGHKHRVISAAFSHDSVQLISASADGTINIWNANSGDCLHTLKDNVSTQSVVFSHDSRWLASASIDGTVKIWNASSGKCLQTLDGHGHWVNSVAFSHDSARLASGSDDETIKIWDTSSSEGLQTTEHHKQHVRSVAFSNDSILLASAAGDNTVKIWDTRNMKCLHTLKGHNDWVTLVTFSSDSTRLASACLNKVIRIWNVSSGECLQTHDGFVMSVAFSPDSTRLASACLNKVIRIWDASSGECLQTLNTGKILSNISFDITGSYLCTETGTIAINAPSVSIMAPSVTDPHSPPYQSLALSPDKEWITFGSKNQLWLPPEYRPAFSDTVVVAGRMVGIGTRSGKVWICNIELDES